MDHSAHNKIVSFIWSIAHDCLRDVFVRGKYRDVILPMFVLRRLDCLLEPYQEAVLEEVGFQRVDAAMADLDPHGLRNASGYVFYNISRFNVKLAQRSSSPSPACAPISSTLAINLRPLPSPPPSEEGAVWLGALTPKWCASAPYGKVHRAQFGRGICDRGLSRKR